MNYWQTPDCPSYPGRCCPVQYAVPLPRSPASACTGGHVPGAAATHRPWRNSRHFECALTARHRRRLPPRRRDRQATTLLTRIVARQPHRRTSTDAGRPMCRRCRHRMHRHLRIVHETVHWRRTTRVDRSNVVAAKAHLPSKTLTLSPTTPIRPVAIIVITALSV